MESPRLALLIPVVLAGCAAPGATDTAGGLRLPGEIAALVFETRPGGEFALEIDAYGEILGAEAEVDLAAIPQACREAADRHFPGGKAVSAEKEIVAGVQYFEVIKEIHGQRFEILMNPDGSRAGHEEALEKGKAPAKVVEAALAAAGGGTLEVAERVSGPEAAVGEDFHVKVKSGSGEILRVSVKEDGTVLRVVRKMRCDFRAPK
jgi:hypothetical protein